MAEELDVPINRIELIQGDTLLTPDQGKTWASLTIQIGGMQLRQASAAARQALLAEAAKKLGTDQLTVADGVISGGGKKVSYAELIGGKNFSIKLDPKQPVKEKAPKDYKIVGKSQPRVDIPDKVTGRFTYMQDFNVPGMLHGRVVRPPGDRRQARKRGRELRSRTFRASSRWCARAISSVSSRRTNGTRSAARSALKVTWSKSETLPDQAKLWEHVRATKVVKEEVTSNVGNAAEAMAKDGVKKLVKATYDFAIHTHGSIGPSCAIAEFKDGMLTSWSASQATHDLRKQLALMFGALARQRALHLCGRLRLLRPQRPRGCRRRCRLAGEGGGQAGARAMVARRRARLGSERPADADGSARRAWMTQAT